MPLKLIPPSTSRRTPYFSVRGTYIGVYVDRSTKTAARRQAKKILKDWEGQIERGEYEGKQNLEPPVEMTFAGAAVAYMNAGGERRFLGPAIAKLGMLTLTNIDQASIDAAAVAAFPKGTAAYRNRNFYTPVSAVLKHVGVEKKIKRPKGWRGKQATSWLEPHQAFAIFKAADSIDPEFGLLLRVYCYTGRRLSEVLEIRISAVNLHRQTIYLPDTKNGDPAPVYLPPILIKALAKHPRGLDRDEREKLFRWSKGGRLYTLWKKVKAAAGVSFPPRQGGFHLFCHTYGTWLHRLGLDAWDMTETKRWKDPASAKRYAHTEPGEMARKADLFPIEKKARR